ncbi:MAG: preprotein translocase subunit SecE [Planctomycetia bacterium]|nr:preprotein translocase subunit SecE [Planctomycetia bacterium]
MSAVIGEMFNPGLYKRTQGRIARQLTFAALAMGVLVGCWSLSQTLIENHPLWRLGLPGVLALLGLWVSYRIVNIPRFADFLIAVEAEMNKVSWPSKRELYRGSAVVLVTMLLLATVLFLYDLFWRWVFADLLNIM